MPGASQDRCSFCRKRAVEIEQLFHGPGVIICNECVELFSRPEVSGDGAALADRSLLDRLPEDEAQVVCMRFGLAGQEPRTFEDIAETLGMTIDEVRSLEGAAAERFVDWASEASA